MRSIIVLAAIAITFLSARRALAEEKSLASRGQSFYQQYCSSCHGPTGKGDGLLADAMKKETPNLTQIAKRRNGSFPKAEIAEVIDGRKEIREHGPRLMPVWGLRLSDAAPHERPAPKEAFVENRIEAILAYLKSIQEK
jgi:mono/diheme cytochrome c family protein